MFCIIYIYICVCIFRYFCTYVQTDSFPPTCNHFFRLLSQPAWSVCLGCALPSLQRCPQVHTVRAYEQRLPQFFAVLIVRFWVGSGWSGVVSVRFVCVELGLFRLLVIGAQDHGWEHESLWVVVMAACPPSEEVQTLLRNPRFLSRVIYYRGSVMDPRDMAAVCAE